MECIITSVYAASILYCSTLTGVTERFVPPRGTSTVVPVHYINARRVVVTRGAGTFVNICRKKIIQHHYNDVIRSTMTSQITSLAIVYSTVYSGADQRKLQSSTSLAFVRGIHRWPMNSLHKGPVTRNMFLFDDVIMLYGAILCFFTDLQRYTRQCAFKYVVVWLATFTNMD